MSQNIVIPSFLDEKLKDARFNYVALQAIKDFQEWFTDSKMPFFPDYTDHGINHLNDVLATAANLIPANSQPYFTPADATVLIMAVLFHDSALHLSENGFYELIQGDYSNNFVKTFDKQNWKQTWHDFIFNARRWDENKLIDVFGAAKNGEPLAQVRDPFDDWENLNKHDYKLVGEFIRQHHPRIAHEMTIFGVPGDSGVAFSINNELPKPWRDLIGLVARSHGLPLRVCVDYLSVNTIWGVDAKHEYQNIHAVYIMALLRIADYVQIQTNRSSELVFKYKKVPSRISVLEHKVHKSIINITNRTLDPESLRIDANPEEVAIFLRLKEWLAGIQYELDASWAVFGEVYGRQDGLKHLGLAFRRIRSNLDNVQSFAETVQYVPDRIHFEASRAELLPLLLGPLYGDDPTYGVRELIQNAVDAVRELEKFLEDNANYDKQSRCDQDADVIVSLSALDDSGQAYMIISDRGIGMTEDTIRNYFLKAGASYRRSSQWKNAFETNDNEGRNVAKVIRSGRFGVGALAAFLIGKEIEVCTRHITASEGYTFKTTLNANLIEVYRDSKLSVGTSIKIGVDRSSYQKLFFHNFRKYRPDFWDWYRFNTPTVIREFTGSDGNRQRLYPSQYINPLAQDGTWRKLESSLAYDVYWTFEEAPALTCNGIYVDDEKSIKQLPGSYLQRGDLINLDLITLPNIALIDPQGQAPLNLKRSGFTSPHIPFIAELLEDFLTEMLAWLLFKGPKSINDRDFSQISFRAWFAQPATNSFIANINGYALKLSVLLQNLELRHRVNYTTGMEIKVLNDKTYVSIGDKGSPNGSGAFVNIHITNPDKPSNIVLPDKPQGYNPNAVHIYHRRVMYDYTSGEQVVKKKRKFPRDYTQSFGDNYFNADIFGLHGFDMRKLGKSIEDASLPIQEKNEGPWLFQVNKAECPAQGFEIVKFPDIPQRSDFELVNRIAILDEYFYKEGTYIRATSQPWLLDKLWEKYFGLKWIPYSLEARIREFTKTAKIFARKYPHLISPEIQNLLPED